MQSELELGRRKARPGINGICQNCRNKQRSDCLIGKAGERPQGKSVAPAYGSTQGFWLWRCTWEAAFHPSGARLGAGVSPKRARKGIRGRGCGDVHLPSASQSNHFPNLLFCSAVSRLTGRATCAHDPGRSLWGQKQKYTRNEAVDYLIPKQFSDYA